MERAPAEDEAPAKRVRVAVLVGGEEVGAPPPPRLPDNSEPYKHGAWRREPFARTEFIELADGYRVCGDDAAVRLRTDARQICDKPENLLFVSVPPEKPLIDAVEKKRFLKLGTDVVQQDVWGIDSYTRRLVCDLLPAALFPTKADRERFVQAQLLPKINVQALGAAPSMAGALGLLAVATQDEALRTALLDLVDIVQRSAEGHFRIHPKGAGVICNQRGGIPAHTLLTCYFGEVLSPYMMFEKQDVFRKLSPNAELPDFYNITMERPSSDPLGYDVLCVDAVHQGAFASRLAHSCDANCGTLTIAAGGRIQIAMYTLRKVAFGEELTFDYHSVTESEKELRSAICLCGTGACRGSYLDFAGSTTYANVMNKIHDFLDRNVMLLRAGTEPLTDADWDRLAEYGFKEAALGRGYQAHRTNPDARVELGAAHVFGDHRVFEGGQGAGDDQQPECPTWLVKWAALALEYVTREAELLPAELEKLGYGKSSEWVARGVRSYRVQNVAITLNKLRYFLRNQSAGSARLPPLIPLSDDAVVTYLWRGKQSLVARLVAAVAAEQWPELGQVLAVVRPDEARDGVGDRDMVKLATRDGGSASVCTVEQIQTQLLALREIARARGPSAAALADLLHLHSLTSTYFTAAPTAGFRSPDTREYTWVGLNEEEREKRFGGCVCANCAFAGRKHREVRRKKYGASFAWGQLVGWFKQTVYDPTASLSAERRGSLSMPDLESCFGARVRYDAKSRAKLAKLVQTRPSQLWPVSFHWSFKNKHKIYGSPMFDDALAGGHAVGVRTQQFLNGLRE